ncbi:glycosyltransferase family 4 protein [Georgenia sp. TF02-10]|uniref:glycosyltransferase family 4 protein n=1 Tax=Georgenia sp. TF02-10 TaxID=2917725 RepID=UPI001FA70822|nr:glycosyltransferase family 4 protein [Georgenia sp. TF02-10]UNX54280.1 glycosyltransferase family 4 protein [Georgenia sp. TF02-10]
MRVAHVSDCYPPRVGGIETQVRDLAAHQHRAGLDVHVLTATADGGPHPANGGRHPARGNHPGGGPRPAGDPPPADGDGPVVHRLATPLTFGVPVHPLERPLLRRHLSALRPDVVHVHAGVLSPFAYAGARAALRLGLPLALTWHCMLDGVTGLYRALAGPTGWRTAPVALSAVSAVAGRRVAAVFDRPEEDVLVLPNGVDVAAWAPPAVGRAPLPPAGPLRVVATQRLAPRKRAVPLVRLVARAHARLRAAGAPGLTLTLIGAGPAEGAVRAEVARLGLGAVVDLPGRVDHDRLRAHYAGVHVFVAPARLEAFGIAALEARAAGLAVVAGRGTGVSEFITDGVDGLLTADRAAGLDDAAADAALARALVTLGTPGGPLGPILRHNAAVPPAADWADVLTAADRLYAVARAASGAVR